MPRSDDENDFLHTFTSEGEGKSKSTRIAPLEVGRDDAPARLLALDELGSGSIRTPPSGTRLLHFDAAGKLVSETGSGTTEEVRGADDLVTLTGSPVPVGSGTDLELEQGQSIRDETGSDRITVDSSGVTISTLDVNTFSTTPRFDQGFQVDEGEAIEDDTGTSRVSINAGSVGISTADVGSFSTQPTFSAGLEVSTGQNIEDEGGTRRASIGGASTAIRNDAGELAVLAAANSQLQLFARDAEPLRVFDEEFSGIAIEYNTSSTAPGQLDLSNAEVSSDLQLQTGQSLVDGSGTARVELLSDRTRLVDNNDVDIMNAIGGFETNINVTAGRPLTVLDKDGGFDALQYSSSSSPPGTLTLDNAVVDFQAGLGSTTGDSMTANPESDTEDGFIEVEISGTRFQIPAYAP